MYWVHFWRLRSDRNSIPTWPRHSITLSFDIGVLYCAQLHGSCHTGSGAGCSPVHIKTAKIDDDFQFYPCFNGLPSENLEDYTFEVEALAAGSKDDEKKLIGPRLVRRLGGVPGAFARRELHMPDLAKPDGYKTNFVVPREKENKKDALDRRLPANRRYEAVARCPGQTLQDFFATDNMANADAVKAGVGIDPDRRA